MLCEPDYYIDNKISAFSRLEAFEHYFVCYVDEQNHQLGTE